MSKKIFRRDEVNINETWDFSRLYKSEELYLKDLELLTSLVNKFQDTYQQNLISSDTIGQAIDDFQEIIKLMTYTYSYQSLHSSVDQMNDQNLRRSGEFQILFNDLSTKLTFFNNELLLVDDKVLIEVKTNHQHISRYIDDLIDSKKHKLDPKVEIALSHLSPVLSLPYSNYNSFKFGDMGFANFEVNEQSFPNSFTMFENEWSYELNHNIRRSAYESFYHDLGKYQTGLANNYAAQVLKEKALGKLKNFDSTIEYLLYDQKVSVDMYDRQIDLIMQLLSKPMQKYANLIKEIYQLDQMTYADLHLSIDPDYEPSISIAEARTYSIESLKVFGPEYEDLVRRAFDERWIDFPQNVGKSTGGFCSSPYQKGSFILLNWNSQMNEAFVLAHELGHAGHFHYASKYQNVYDEEASLYFIEAPSTMNELIMADYFDKRNDDLRLKRYVLSNLISRTYYHNFVTHLLEAHYQREVYRLADQNKPININVLNEIKLNTLKTFWGDSVEIPEYAGLTWMRQPHYFMGLYPYTYSAGLTIATTVFNKIKNGQLNFQDWLEVLKAGGTKTPLELARIVDVDLSTEKPLIDTINTISQIIDEIILITDKLNQTEK